MVDGTCLDCWVTCQQAGNLAAKEAGERQCQPVTTFFSVHLVCCHPPPASFFSLQSLSSSGSPQCQIGTGEMSHLDLGHSSLPFQCEDSHYPILLWGPMLTNPLNMTYVYIPFVLLQRSLPDLSCGVLCLLRILQSILTRRPRNAVSGLLRQEDYHQMQALDSTESNTFFFIK